MRVLIHNQKGGVGKTTTAANLGAALLRGRLARRVVLADLDPQMHLTAMLTPADAVPEWTVSDWLAGRAGHPVAVEGEQGLLLIPGTDGPVQVVAPQSGDIAKEWTLIDSAPAWSEHTAVLSHWADIILCPLEPDFLGLSGVSRLLMRFAEIGVPRERLRFLLCRYSARLSVHRDVQAMLVERLGPELVLPVTVRSSVRLSEAPGFGKTVYRHAPASTGCTDYSALARLLARPAVQPSLRSA
jgi:chromosome partitioning protein